MTASARDVAAAIRERLPEVGKVALHKLLYYCQGHHLATFGVPLFTETISAWDRGPVVGALWREERYGHEDLPPDEEPQPRALTNAELNTVGYVVSRYGALSGKDLENLSHSEAPWQTANALREPGGRVTIRTEWIRDYFVANGYAPEDEDDEPLDSEVVRDWLAAVRPPTEPPRPDSREAILARLRG